MRSGRAEADGNEVLKMVGLYISVVGTAVAVLLTIIAVACLVIDDGEYAMRYMLAAMTLMLFVLLVFLVTVCGGCL